MKYAVISYPDSINIGDEVQSVAAMRLLPQVDYLMPREEIHTFDKECKLICNGWFTDDANAWPPSDKIDPLFVSFHATAKKGVNKKIITPELASYYKQYAPIGCRDKKTVEYFKNIGVDAYFSGCLTLTLENTFNTRSEKILLVDPLRFNYTKPYREFIVDSLVPEKYKKDVEIICQRRTDLSVSVEQRFKDAEELLKKYATAKLVITSRLHCALPCLALGTPVYFINAGYHSTHLNLDDRFDGLIEMFDQIPESWLPNSSSSIIDRLKRITNTFSKDIQPLDIDWDNPKPNSFDIKPIVDSLRERVKNFI